MGNIWHRDQIQTFKDLVFYLHNHSLESWFIFYSNAIEPNDLLCSPKKFIKEIEDYQNTKLSIEAVSQAPLLREVKFRLNEKQSKAQGLGVLQCSIQLSPDCDHEVNRLDQILNVHFRDSKTREKLLKEITIGMEIIFLSGQIERLNLKKEYINGYCFTPSYHELKKTTQPLTHHHYANSFRYEQLELPLRLEIAADLESPEIGVGIYHIYNSVYKTLPRIAPSIDELRNGRKFNYKNTNKHGTATRKNYAVSMTLILLELFGLKEGVTENSIEYIVRNKKRYCHSTEEYRKRFSILSDTITKPTTNRILFYTWALKSHPLTIGKLINYKQANIPTVKVG